MTEQEYKLNLAELKKETKSKEDTLKLEYFMSQRKFQIGDIIKSHNQIIVIEKFGTYLAFSNGLPLPCYIGAVLTKSLKPRKNGKKGAVYGNDNVELIK